MDANKYKEIFEKYFLSKIDLKKYDEEISTNELGIGDNHAQIQLKSGLNEYLNLNHFYILNSFNINILSEEDKNKLLNEEIEEQYKIIEKTFREVIKYNDSSIKKDRYKVNYTYSTDIKDYAYNDELVIALYYGSNKNKYGSKEEYLNHYNKRVEYLNDMTDKIKKEIKDKLNVDASFIIRKI
jgi:hypothetical protein